MDFTHLTYNDYLEDAKVTWHINAIEKVAVVSDVDWINDTIKCLSLSF
jgi:hypothetical protein